MTTRRDHERALAGAALLDDGIARLLPAEIELGEIADPTARLVLCVVGHDPPASRGQSDVADPRRVRAKPRTT